MWIGRVFKCVYGLNHGDEFSVTSEPYNIDRRGTKAVSGISKNVGEMQVQVDELLSSIYWSEVKKPKTPEDIKRMSNKMFSKITKVLNQEKYKTGQGLTSRVYKKDNVIYRIEDDGYTEVIVIGERQWIRDYKGNITLKHMKKK